MLDPVPEAAPTAQANGRDASEMCRAAQAPGTSSLALRKRAGTEPARCLNACTAHPESQAPEVL